jgi:hypothetical protein
MAWYKTGSVSVTTGQQAVTGASTNFVSNVRVGDGFRGPDGRWYEIVNVASETVIGIYPAYVGASTSSTDWMIAPLQGYNKESADRLRAITDSIPGLLDNKQNLNQNLTSMSNLTGSADTIPYFTGAGALSLATLTAKARELNAQTTSGDMRNVLGLGSAATRDVTVGVVDMSAGRLLKAGDFGLGSSCVSIGDWNAAFTDYGNTFISGNAVFPGGTGESINATGLSFRLNSGPIGGQMMIYGGDNQMWFRSAYNGWLPWVKVYHSGNTSKAADGTLKAN